MQHRAWMQGVRCADQNVKMNFLQAKTRTLPRLPAALSPRGGVECMPSKDLLPLLCEPRNTLGSGPLVLQGIVEALPALALRSETCVHSACDVSPGKTLER